MQLLNDLIKALGLQKPVMLTIKTRRGKDCDAYYMPQYSDRTGKLKAHRITIYTVESTRSFETLLAHELIHAKQEEQSKEEFHGKYFVKWAADLEKQFPTIKDIYLKGTDEK